MQPSGGSRISGVPPSCRVAGCVGRLSTFRRCCPGIEVLVGAKRARRLGGLRLVPEGLVLDKCKDGKKILVAGGARNSTAYDGERLFMANYAHGVAEQVGIRKAFAICVDASSVSGKDKLTIGVYWHQIPYTAWAPPQE